LTIADGPVLYHAGDTAVFGDMKLIRDLYRPEVAMLPSEGTTPWDRRKRRWPCAMLQPKTILPIHFGTFPPLTGTPEELAALVDAGVQVVRWTPGETPSEL
jgi:L-ascorbate metabolism protein UlaG (beta-lactamase superfamily)